MTTERPPLPPEPPRPPLSPARSRREPPPPGGVNRMSISERRARLAEQPPVAGAAEFMPLEDQDGITSTFRIDLAGGLVHDTAASLVASVDANRPLGELDRRTVGAYHLLALPSDATGDEVEALVVSVWHEAGWTSPGVLHLTEGATLEGPWTMPDDLRDSLGLSSEMVNFWQLRCPALRGSVPAPEMLRIDEWAQAFPEGVPVGTEYTTLRVLHRVARRLHGQLRLAGLGKILSPDPDSAVNLRFYTDQFLSPAELLAALRQRFTNVEVPPGTSLVPGDPTPYALLIDSGEVSRVLVGTRPVERAPRVLRWESWASGPIYLTEINWTGAQTLTLPDGQLTRRGRLERRLLGRTVEEVAATLVDQVANAAVIDEDDFLVDLDELPRAAAEPHL